MIGTPSEGVDIRIDGLNSEGAGVGRLPDGRVLFVPLTAPGDEIRAEVTRTRRRWARGRLLELRRPGPNRREAPCPYFEVCGGCTLQHLGYPAQVSAKVTMVRDALTRIGRFSSLPEPTVHPSPVEWRYRNRVTFLLRRGPVPPGAEGGGGFRSPTEAAESGAVTAGFHRAADGAELLDVDGRCLLPEEPIARAWDQLRSAWGPGAGLLPEGPELRLTLRASHRGEVLLLVSGGRGEGDLGQILLRSPGIRAIWVKTGSRARLVAGSPVVDEWDGWSFELEPDVFLQANRRAAPAMEAAVQRAMGEVSGRTVVDAYCGFGVHGRRAAANGASSVGIESDPAAIRVARKAPSTGFRVLRGSVEERIGEALPSDVVVLNPPRTGVGDGVMERIGQSDPDRIVYVSCDPATLARDLRRLGQGHRLASLEIFDLFPQTAHVETLVTLVRA